MLPNTSRGASLAVWATFCFSGRGPLPRVLLRIAIGHALFKKDKKVGLKGREGLSHKSCLGATGDVALLAVDGQVRGFLVFEVVDGVRGADLLELARLLGEVEAVDDARGALVRRSQLPESPDILNEFSICCRTRIARVRRGPDRWRLRARRAISRASERENPSRPTGP